VKRKYGFNRDKKDSRDKLFSISQKYVIDPLPRQVDLRNFYPPCLDQKSLGTCVLYSGVKAMQYLQMREWKTETVNLSVLFAYYNTRKDSGYLGSDSGASIRDALKSLANYGTCLDSLWPYQVEKFNDEPPLQAYEEAQKHKISRYERLVGIEDMLQCLAEGYPFLFGVDLFESFGSQENSKSGFMPIPKWGEKKLGGHCMKMVAYDLDNRIFTYSNHYGSDYGKNGFGTTSFDYIEKYCKDAWVIIQ